MNQPSRNRLAILQRAGLLLGLLLWLAPTGVGALEVETTVAEDGAVVEPLSDLVGSDVVAADGRLELTLEDAIRLALERNLLLVVQRYRRTQAIQGIREALGIYDLNLGAFGLLGENTSPTTSTLEAADVLVNDFLVGNFNAAQLFPQGGTARLDFNNNRTESSNVAVQPNPQYITGLDLSYTQPLLRDFGRVATNRGILIARTSSAISRETLEIQVETIVQQVIDSYWLLVEARQQLAVSQESLGLAEELHRMNRIQVEVGTLAPLETVRSQAAVATREEEIIRREAAVEDAADVLRRLVNLARGGLWDLEIVPVTEPTVGPVEIDVEAAVDVALAERPDVHLQRLQIRNQEIERAFARNQVKPRLDAQAVWGYNGVGGDVTDFLTGDVFSGGYNDAFQQILDGDFDGWQLSLTFAYPLQNRAARARFAQADLSLDEAEVALDDLELEVLADVRRAARAVETAAKQIESAKVSSDLERQNVEAEQKRYENGISTSFEVLAAQEDLSEARSREVSAITGYRRALAAYHRAVGRLLEEHGIELEEPIDLDEEIDSDYVSGD